MEKELSGVGPDVSLILSVCAPSGDNVGMSAR